MDFAESYMEEEKSKYLNSYICRRIPNIYPKPESVIPLICLEDPEQLSKRQLLQDNLCSDRNLSFLSRLV